MQKIEVTYLMKVLSKPELEGNILLNELMQIMDNIVLEGDGQTPPEEEMGSPEEQPYPEEEEQPEASKKKKDRPVDLSKLD